MEATVTFFTNVQAWNFKYIGMSKVQKGFRSHYFFINIYGTFKAKGTKYFIS